MTSHSSPQEIYRARLDEFSKAAAALPIRYNQISNTRLLVIVWVVICLLAALYWQEQPLLVMISLSGVLLGLGLFIALVAIHARVSAQEDRARGLSLINQQSQARLDGVWDKVPLPLPPAAAQQDILAGDLDLFGRGSLYHLLGTVRTPQGRRILAGWLITPPSAGAPIILQRQAAVAELAPDLDLRQDLEYLATLDLKKPEAAGTDPFVPWVAGESWLQPKPHLVLASRIITALLVASVIIFFCGLVEIAAPLLLLALGARFFLVRHSRGEVQRRLDFICSRQRALASYTDLIHRLRDWRPSAALLRELQEQLRGADGAMSSLQTLVNLAAIRSTPVNPLVQYLLMWDWHTLWFMEQWLEQHRNRVHFWFEALGELEALSGLAVLRFEEPTWAFPRFRDEPTLSARALAHPLLRNTMNVPNDVTLGPPGTCLLVTGSNMSGKSTLLRTIGVNVVLAQAGAPVCAQEMQLPLALRLATSLRVQDSLQDGISYFMAELRRLTWIVDVVDSTDVQHRGPVVLYLLDEILRGTNTLERQVIVGRLVSHLVRRRAIGAITTHDLSLAEVKDIAAAFHPVHFTEQFEEGPQGASMNFDYRMRPGLATTTNALKLLKVIGLNI